MTTLQPMREKNVGPMNCPILSLLMVISYKYYVLFSIGYGYGPKVLPSDIL